MPWMFSNFTFENLFFSHSFNKLLKIIIICRWFRFGTFLVSDNFLQSKTELFISCLSGENRKSERKENLVCFRKSYGTGTTVNKKREKSSATKKKYIWNFFHAEDGIVFELKKSSAPRRKHVSTITCFFYVYLFIYRNVVCLFKIPFYKKWMSPHIFLAPQFNTLINYGT